MQRAATALRIVRSARLDCFCRELSGEVAPASGRLTDLSGLGPKRFYKEVDVKEQANGLFAVTIDGRLVRTPKRTILSAPTDALAQALAAEWDAQGTRIRPSSMPLTSLVSTAHDIVPDFRRRIVPSIMKYLDTDAMCIRPDYPDTLVKAQTEIFDPISDHLAAERGLAFHVNVGGLTATQSDSTRGGILDFVHNLSDLSLAAMNSAVSTSKSVAVAVALHDGLLDAEGATRAARSEEGWQEQVWGTVEGGHDLDAADVLVRLAAADNIFRFVAMAPAKFPRTELS